MTSKVICISLCGLWLSCSAITPWLLLEELLSENAHEQLSGHRAGTKLCLQHLPVADKPQTLPYRILGRFNPMSLLER